MPQFICFSVGDSVTVSSLVIAGREIISDDDECKASNEAAKIIPEVAIASLKEIIEHMSRSHLLLQIQRILDRAPDAPVS